MDKGRGSPLDQPPICLPTVSLCNMKRCLVVSTVLLILYPTSSSISSSENEEKLK